MMQLRDYQIQRVAIPLPGKAVNGVKPSFDVRGLCADDLTFLISQHVGPITKAIKLYQESKEDVLKTGNLQGFVLALARDFPFLVAEVISAATDSLDDETRKIAKTLPVGVQLAAMNEIARLSIEEVGGLKNLLAEMRQRLQGAEAEIESGSAPARPEAN
jgi:hypothetical protein